MISRLEIFRNGWASSMTRPTPGMAADYLEDLLVEWIGVDSSGMLVRDPFLALAMDFEEMGAETGRLCKGLRDPKEISFKLLSYDRIISLMSAIESFLAAEGRLIRIP